MMKGNQVYCVVLFLCWQCPTTAKHGTAFVAFEDAASPPRVPTFDKVVYTEGGNAERAHCVFPFKYKGDMYTECTDVDEQHEGLTWCATTSDYDKDKEWGHCLTEKQMAMCSDASDECGTWAGRGECLTNNAFMNDKCPRSCGICTWGGDSHGKPCVFPFIYNDEVKTKCLPHKGKTWCATTSNYDQHEKWGYCYPKVFEDLGSLNNFYLSYGECDDRDLECPNWAVKGECASNPKFMESKCPWSCRKCAPSELVKSDACTDYSSECEQWSRDGDCRAKPVFMYAFCRYTCRECSKSNGSSGVKDRDPKCTEWAEKGDCKNNPDYMLTNCPKSCMSGGYINNKKCVDKLTECRDWAKEGYCETSKKLMDKQCPFSCGTCN